jgi:hypothetical protein
VLSVLVELTQAGRRILHFEVLRTVISIWNRKECAISLYNMGDEPDYESYEGVPSY